MTDWTEIFRDCYWYTSGLIAWLWRSLKAYTLLKHKEIFVKQKFQLKVQIGKNFYSSFSAMIWVGRIFVSSHKFRTGATALHTRWGRIPDHRSTPDILPPSGQSDQLTSQRPPSFAAVHNWEMLTGLRGLSWCLDEVRGLQPASPSCWAKSCSAVVWTALKSHVHFLFHHLSQDPSLTLLSLLSSLELSSGTGAKRRSPRPGP